MTELKIWPATTVLMQLQDVTAEQLAAFERTIQALRIDMSEEHLAMFTKHGELQLSCCLLGHAVFDPACVEES